MANLKYGSTGDEVKQLQTALGFTGKDVDGIYGKKTEQAVIDYQTNNDLEVDGIAGKNTLGKLYSTNTAAPAAEPAQAPADTNKAADTTQGTFTYEDYVKPELVKSDDVVQAEALLEEWKATRPGEWVDPYRDKYMGYLEQYENRDPFSYDFNSDALYQQYKDQYIQQGQMAMMDTMGQAAAMTGGYGNSYAQTVGQQAYNQQRGQLNEIMPELYQMAYDRYGQEGQELLDMFNMYLGLSEQDYSHYQTGLDNWYQELGYRTDAANTAYDRNWDQYVLDVNTGYDAYSTGRSEAFSNYQTEQNQAFTSSEAEKDRQFTREENEKSMNFTASQSQLDRDAQIEAASIKASTENTYEPYNAELQKTYEKEFAGSKEYADLENVWNKLVYAGVDPKVAADRVTYWANRLGIEIPIEENPIGGGTVGSGGGGGGSVYLWDIK